MSDVFLTFVKKLLCLQSQVLIPLDLLGDTGNKTAGSLGSFSLLMGIY